MDKKVLKYLEDVRRAIEEIEMFVAERPKLFKVFCEDILFRRGVERNLEIIGEAMQRAVKLEPDLRVTNARRIVDTRNLVIHAYDAVRPEMVWGIVINHLPILKDEVGRLLGENDTKL